MSPDVETLFNAPRLLWRWKFLIALVTLAAMGAGWWQTQRTHEVYASQATLMYRFGREYFPISPGEQRREWGENIMVSLDAALFTEMRLLTGREVFESAVKEVGEDALRAAGPGDGSPKTFDQLVKQTMAQTDVRRVEGASLVTVSMRGSSPELTDKLLDQQIWSYIAMRQELFDRDPLAFFDRQIEVAKAQYDTLLAEKGRLQTQYSSSNYEVEWAAAKERLAQLERSDVERPGDPTIARDLDETRATTDQLSKLWLQLQPLNARLDAANANLAGLETERANAVITRAYRETVSPVIEIVDRTSAAKNPVGPSKAGMMVMAGVFGFLFSCLAVLAFGMLAAARRRAPKPGPV